MQSGVLSRQTRAGLDAVIDPAVLEKRSTKQALSRWRQGSLLAGVPIVWAAVDGYDELTNLTTRADTDDLTQDKAGDLEGHDETQGKNDELSGGPEVEGAANGGSPVLDRLPVAVWDEQDVLATPGVERALSEEGWAIVTSQTCDIGSTGPGARHPVVQVSPVVSMTGTNPQRLADAKRGTVTELVHLPNFPAAGDWFVDLRISIPVGKGVLMEREPIPGFATDAEANQFSERVALKFRRAALHDAIHEVLRPSLCRAVADGVEAGHSWPDDIEQFRVLVRKGDRLKPENVAVVAVCYQKLSTFDRVALRTWRMSIMRTFKRSADGCQLGAVMFTTVDTMNVRDYRDSLFMSVPELGGSVFW